VTGTGQQVAQLHDRYDDNDDYAVPTNCPHSTWFFFFALLSTTYIRPSNSDIMSLPLSIISSNIIVKEVSDLENSTIPSTCQVNSI